LKSQAAYARHILECIRRIREDTSVGEAAVFGSRTIQDAVLRNLQILCESTQRLDQSLKTPHPSIPWKAIAGMRNVIVHDYFEVDFKAIWSVVVSDLEPLNEAISLILTELERRDALSVPQATTEA
jgi:uncharacterized protein with HEPN domain